MSLQVWLPLNGNINNQGLSNVVVTNNGATIDNNGKIGKCYSFSSSNSAYLQLPQLSINRSEMSFCIWAKYKAWDNWSRLFDFGAASGAGDTLLLSHSGTSNIFYVGCKTGGTSRDFSYAANLSLNTWYHFAIIKKGLEWKLYLNGNLVYTTNLAGDFSTDPVIFKNNFLGRSNWSQDSYLNGQLNDFRIYNHALSAKEVKELAKGLVLHYRLAGPGQENLVKNSQLATSWGTGDVQQCNEPTGYSFNGECIKITSGTSGNQNNGYGLLLRTSDISYSVGEKLTFSVDIKGSGRHIGLWFLGADGNWWTGTNFHTYFTQYNDWTRISVTGTVPSGAPRIMLGLHAGLSNNTLYAKNMKLERGSISTPWCPNSVDSLYSSLGFNSNIEPDCSGFNNNGTKSGSIISNSNSPRYSSSYKFNTGVDYIKSAFTLSMSELSCSFWVKPNSSNGGYSIIASNYNNPPSGFWLAINTEGSGVWFYNGTYVSGASLLKNDVWHHCVFTFKNGIGTWYVNGTSVISTDISSRGTSLSINNLTVGNSYTGTSWNTKNYGYVSDFRFYATALSAADVLELYNVPIMIDKSGNIYSYEYQEV